MYANDWLSSSRIAAMSAAQERGYLRLLLHAWNDPNCSLPDDDDKLARLSLLNEGWFDGSSRLVRECFVNHPDIDGRIINQKLFEIRQERLEWKEKCARGGVKSGRSRRLQSANKTRSKGEVKGEVKGNSSSSSSIGLSTNVDNHSRKSSKASASYSADFETWWSTYPRKEGKQAAFKSWQRAISRYRDQHDCDRNAALSAILEAARKFSQSAKAKGEFCPHAKTWLNEGRYDDDPDSWGSASKSRVPDAEDLAHWNPVDGGLGQ